ncbi:hypothetical protein ACVIW2_000207 [Bradyrhizobium huanghuaihaiense]|uniref:Uncharacterized protein n=1 Tax=Bradyrhizobium barranii subsp. barranii TaxID=2823807 RepID=A0A7Z0QQ22_9BRAD|nr:hypothetical protein [Bradyrhizobium barranii]UGX89673.1 hypothetical protein G6321_00000830 [Bradyrhizobium barranii subsp. barranii]
MTAPGERGGDEPIVGPLWVNRNTHEIRVMAIGTDRAINSSDGWSDPLGAANAEWRELTNPARVQLMLETAIDLAMQGYELKTVLRAFAGVLNSAPWGRRAIRCAVL